MVLNLFIVLGKLIRLSKVVKILPFKKDVKDRINRAINA
jgi:hypothetical protein